MYRAAVIFRTIFTLALFASLTLACQQDVARALQQSQALRIATTLRHHNVEATLRTDGETYRVRVQPDDRRRAEAIIVDGDLLREETLPQHVTPRSGLDASQSTRKREEERAAAIATALRALPGVREARVTLTLCEPSTRTHELCPNPNQLSALLVLDPDATPPEEDALRRWLAASIPQATDTEVALLWSHAPSVALPFEAPKPAATAARYLPGLIALATLLLILAGGGAFFLRWKQRQTEPAEHAALVTT